MTFYKSIIRTDLKDPEKEDIEKALSFGPMKLIVHERVLEKIRRMIPDIFVVTTGQTGGPHPYEIWAEVREGENGEIRPAFISPSESIPSKEKKLHILAVDVKKLVNQKLTVTDIVKHYREKGLKVSKYQIDNIIEGKCKRGYIRVRKEENVSAPSSIPPIENSTSIRVSKNTVRRQITDSDKDKKKAKLQKVRKVNTKR